MTDGDLSDLTVVVPVRNAESFITECLEGILSDRPAEVIVVDGLSSDRTLELAARYPVRVLSDEGRGVAAARLLGAHAATTDWLALVDVDVMLTSGDLAAVLDEAQEGGYTALQAGLESTSGPGYWGRALVQHHRSGLSKHWFGLVATVFEREAFLSNGLDAAFLSGEDIDLRWRLEHAGARIGVSSRTIVDHRFGDTFDFAIGQFLADGGGLARMAGKHGWRAAPLLGLPFAAGARGMALSLLRREPQWIPYYATFVAFNWLGMTRQLARQASRRPDPS
ncbi:MAG TPA: glycosyltransferase [Candidatus Limnocylindria bacterium]|nr:glycosyltransferase [Candidatus Limnocylindria bacterium]